MPRVHVRFATGIKYPPFIVFSGCPDGKVWAEVSSKTVGFPQYVHAVQRKAWTDHDHMVTLKVHKMQDIKYDFEKKCHTQVMYIPPYITGLRQPMDVSVMHSSSAELYVAYHIGRPFPATPAERQSMLSKIVERAWDLVEPKTIIDGCKNANRFPIGPRDARGRFCAFPLDPPKDTIASALKK
ncbi:hypothetical protein PHMEG_00019747 [Phytophthora megakarya]|uniref:DDE-1 domain-containing protein n=1 Tax=Phytophthora megakarya TaxID=4795 RepID=A0A225VSD5_9STRA|nr:hypothetical protein PHMEG_00019747 [Phytophthora megakarya]